ncbi:iron-sulfur cluster assembly scaffold protein [Candidatus Gottesmanbacteria bacterium]|nr:iron-sulfur cluster assembly scaffold protein [Candidatus Gottesmanbacteria bacterium]
MDLYREIILDHYKHPRNFGVLETPDVKASEYNATCGDRISIELCVYASTRKRIKDARFSGDGCAISVASASMLMEKIIGMGVKDIIALTANDIIDMLGTELTPSRTKCALLPLEVLQKAVLSLQS